LVSVSSYKDHQQNARTHEHNQKETSDQGKLSSSLQSETADTASSVSSECPRTESFMIDCAAGIESV